MKRSGVNPKGNGSPNSICAVFPINRKTEWNSRVRPPLPSSFFKGMGRSKHSVRNARSWQICSHVSLEIASCLDLLLKASVPTTSLKFGTGLAPSPQLRVAKLRERPLLEAWGSPRALKNGAFERFPEPAVQPCFACRKRAN